MTTPDAARQDRPHPPIYVDERGSVACIGVFDGVHRGHQALLRLARERADVVGVPLVAITFDPHPMAVVGPRVAPPSLASLEHRIDLLRTAGADEVDVLAFDESVARMDPQEFVHRVLVERLRIREVVVGQDFRFGHLAAGNVDTLVAEGARHGFRVTAAPLVGDGAHRWSSTAVRALVAGGDVAAAATALGRPYRMDGLVVHGDHRGRDLGYPTANLAWTDDPVVPADGVYAGWLHTDVGILPAAVSVGSNPQFDGVVRRVESYALQRDDLDLYGQRVGVDFVERLRGQARFPDVPALVDQMGRDVEEAGRVLGFGGP